MEQSSISYTELDFQLLKVEISDLERLVTQLKSSVVGSNVVIDQIYLEVLLESQLAKRASIYRMSILSLVFRLEKCSLSLLQPVVLLQYFIRTN